MYPLSQNWKNSSCMPSMDSLFSVAMSFFCSFLSRIHTHQGWKKWQRCKTHFSFFTAFYTLYLVPFWLAVWLFPIEERSIFFLYFLAICNGQICIYCLVVPGTSTSQCPSPVEGYILQCLWRQCCVISCVAGVTAWCDQWGVKFGIGLYLINVELVWIDKLNPLAHWR